MAPIQFICEGNADSILLETFGIPKRFINISGGNSALSRAMLHLKDDFHKKVVALTDKDKKNIPDYLKAFQHIEAKHGVFYRSMKATKHYLIFLEPPIEGWVLKEAKSVNILPTKFGLPTEVKDLKKITRQQSIKSNTGFREFLNAIKAAKSPGFLFLQQIIATHYPIFEA